LYFRLGKAFFQARSPDVNVAGHRPQPVPFQARATSPSRVAALYKLHPGFLARDYPIRYPTMLPKGRVLIEILESIQPDDEIIVCSSGLEATEHSIALGFRFFSCHRERGTG
jgi:hypothetical protein